MSYDMMQNAFHRNMTKAILVSGDRDFKPVVQSVAQAGTYVEVWFKKETGSTDLARETDNLVYLDLRRLAEFTNRDPDDHRGNRFPRHSDFGWGNVDPVGPLSSWLFRGTSNYEGGEGRTR
jgi:uncharacterized LabA/DUF88 family protein